MEKAFPEKLSDLRRDKGVSQRTAASDLKISQALLSHYENGLREPGLEFLVRACDYYGVSADYLLGRCEEPEGFAGGVNSEQLLTLLKLVTELVGAGLSGRDADELKALYLCAEDAVNNKKRRDAR